MQNWVHKGVVFRSYRMSAKIRNITSPSDIPFFPHAESCVRLNGNDRRSTKMSWLTLALFVPQGYFKSLTKNHSLNRGRRQHSEADSSREPHRERGDNFFPRCALIRGMHETSNDDWWDARVTWQLTPLSLEALLQGLHVQSYDIMILVSIRITSVQGNVKILNQIFKLTSEIQILTSRG